MPPDHLSDPGAILCQTIFEAIIMLRITVYKVLALDSILLLEGPTSKQRVICDLQHLY